ncbi:MAG: hypothetical protein K2J20_05955 [Bacilli bacterium]|nr:hypothetical protein [Bacilli bacterium]
MKKTLKNSIVSLFIIIALLAFTDNVNAETRQGAYGSITTGKTYSAKGVTTIRQYTVSDVSGSTTYGYYAKEDISARGVKLSTGGAHTIFYHREGTATETKRWLFCLDATNAGDPDLFASRFLLPADGSGGPRQDAFDIGVMSIYLSNATGSMWSFDDYFIKTTAIRILSALWSFDKFGGSTGGGSLALQNSYIGTAYSLIANNANIGQLYDSIVASMATINLIPITTKNKLAQYKNYTMIDNGGSNVSKVAVVLEAALKDISDYLSEVEGSGSSQVTEAVSSTSTKTETITDNIGELKQAIVYKTYTVKNWTASTTFKIDSIKYNQEYSGVLDPEVVAIKVNGTTVCDALEGSDSTCNNFDLASHAEKGKDNEFEFAIKFAGYASVKDEYANTYKTLNCGQQPLEYTIAYSLGGENAENSILKKYSKYVGIVWWGKRDSKQRFISVEQLTSTDPGDNDDNEATTGTSTGTIQLITECSCDELIEACEAEAKDKGNINGEACKELIESNCGDCSILEIQCNILNNDDEACKKMELVCGGGCGSDIIGDFECCDENDDTLEVSLNDNHKVSILGPGPDNTENSNIKLCFVSQVDNKCDEAGDASSSDCTGTGIEDEKGNSYSLVDMNNNKYCTVSCKEDYLMTLPTAKLVNAGRYFTFKAEIKGTKTCYTNTIDREQYNIDIVDAQKEMIDAYNVYLKWKTLYKSIETVATPPIRTAKYTSGWTCTNGCSATEQTKEYPRWWSLNVTTRNNEYITYGNITEAYKTGVLTTGRRNETFKHEEVRYERTGSGTTPSEGYCAANPIPSGNYYYNPSTSTYEVPVGATGSWTTTCTLNTTTGLYNETGTSYCETVAYNTATGKYKVTSYSAVPDYSSPIPTTCGATGQTDYETYYTFPNDFTEVMNASQLKTALQQKMSEALDTLNKKQEKLHVF